MDGQAGCVDGGIEADGITTLVVVRGRKNTFLLIVAEDILAHTKRRSRFRVNHDNRFERMVIVGIKKQFDLLNPFLFGPV